MLKEVDIKVLVAAHLLLGQYIINWRAAYGNPWPMETYPDEMIIFTHFIERGLALLTSDFFCGLLEFYKLELVHLNPNSILHIAIFVHLCEAFLGI